MNLESLPGWIAELLSMKLAWTVTGSAGGIRAKTFARDREDHSIVYLNLVTALAAGRGLNFQSGDFRTAAKAIGMHDDVASLLSSAGDNNLPQSHILYESMTSLVEYLAKGEHL